MEQKEYQRLWRIKNRGYETERKRAIKTGTWSERSNPRKHRQGGGVVIEGGHNSEAAQKARAANAARRYDPDRKKRGKQTFRPSDVAALRLLQGGCCALCTRTLDPNGNRQPNTEAADHCANSKTPRGLLCWACNISLGWYEKQQRPSGLRIQPYEDYLATPPYSKLGALPVSS